MNIWLYSDPHFGHANMLSFTNDAGEKIRPQFSDVDEMDQVLVRKYNARVGPNDKVYFLGDVAFKAEVLHRIMPQLNGQKRLILGNHDKLHMSNYIKYFTKIYESWQPVRNTLLTHRPVHLGDHHEKVAINIHGHTHGFCLDDPRYYNVCVEVQNYQPIHWEEVLVDLEKRGLKPE